MTLAFLSISEIFQMLVLGPVQVTPVAYIINTDMPLEL
jgi:hypothetical protein